MPRTPRDSAPGLHHVWVNATGNESYFIDDVDRIEWIRQLARTLDVYDWRCIAFAQLTTHVHLILEIADWSLPLGMRQLNYEHSVGFNLRHARGGQFVRRRYGNRRIDSGDDLIGAFVYVVLNPVKAGLALRPELWRWSSYATTLGISSDFPFVDASLVLAEVGGSVERLRATVDAEHARYVAKTGTSGV